MTQVFSESLPSRERGLKRLICLQGVDRVRSLPSRERGLKPFWPPSPVPAFPVAPFAGAWIETGYSGYLDLDIFVAPFAGAWIETPYRH